MTFRFGDFELDGATRSLRRRSRLRPRLDTKLAADRSVVELLLHLVANRERDVPESELAATLWRDEEPPAGGVDAVVERARRVLGDAAHGALARTDGAAPGWRFVLPVEPSDAGARSGVSPGLRRPAMAERFIGRDVVVERCRPLLAGPAPKPPALILLCGEAGIGKTRTARELAEHAQRTGTAVLRARATEGSDALPFQPWRQLLERWITTADCRPVATHLGPGRLAELAGIAPALRRHFPNLPGLTGGEPQHQRHRRFEAVAEWVAACSAARPLLLVLDDLHWADRSSLRLLEFVLRCGRLRRARLAVLGTFRDDAPREEAPLLEELDALRPLAPGPRIALTGLERSDVARFVEDVTGEEPPAGLVDALMRRTGGNPFFIREIVRLLHVVGQVASPQRADAWESTLPLAVQDAVDQRLRRLSASCAEILRVAAVAGRRFDPEVLAIAAEADPFDVGVWLSEAANARLVADAPAGQRSFVHGLVQDAIYARIDVEERAALHGRIARALEEASAARPDDRVAEIAHHYRRSADPDDAPRAVRFALRAARRAGEARAFHEEALHCERALASLARARRPSARQRAEVMLALARARGRAGERERALEDFRAAAVFARDSGLPSLFGAAALGYAEQGRALSSPRESPSLLLRDALEQLGPWDEPLRVRLLCELARLEAAAARATGAERLAQEALDLAREIGDEGALSAALDAATALRAGDPGAAERRLAWSTEALALCERSPDRQPPFDARLHRMVALLELGDLREFEHESDRFGAEAETSGYPALRWTAHTGLAMRALLAGDFGRSEERIGRARALAHELGHPDGELAFALQMTQLRFHQERVDEIDEPVRQIAEALPALGGMRATLALVDALVGRAAESRRALARWTADDCARLPRDDGWLVSLSLLAVASHRLGERESAAVLYRQLKPLALQNACVHVVACCGSVSFFLGLLADVLGERRTACEHFRDAMLLNRRLAARPWQAQTAFHWARVLAGEPSGEAREEAGRVAAVAAASAAEVGMDALAARSEELARELGKPLAPA